MKVKLAVLAFATFAAASSAAAQSATTCADRDAVLKRLAEGYGESRQSIGVAPQGRVIEIFASLETGTWTITVTMPSGMTCLVASGDSFENLEEPLAPAGVPS